MPDAKCESCGHEFEYSQTDVKSHMLACGSSREPIAAEEIFGAGSVSVAFTSPPYASQRKYDEASEFKPVPPDEYLEWFRPVAELAKSLLADDGSWFVNIKAHADEGQRHLYVRDLTIAHVREWDWLFVDEFCWRKGANGVPGGWPNRFKNAFEPVFHFTKQREIKFRPAAVSTKSDGVFTYEQMKKHGKPCSTGSGFTTGAPIMEGLARPSNVLEINESRGNLHSAAFPVELPEWFIKAFTDPCDVVFDPFMGSGTTMIAAERLNRTCYGLEISPRYCDVIVQRWEEFTGHDVRRVRA